MKRLRRKSAGSHLQLKPKKPPKRDWNSVIDPVILIVPLPLCCLPLIKEEMACTYLSNLVFKVRVAKIILLHLDKLTEQDASNLIFLWKFVKQKELVDFFNLKKGLRDSSPSEEVKSESKLLLSAIDDQKQSSYLTINIVLEFGSYILVEFKKELKKVEKLQRKFPGMDTNQSSSLKQVKTGLKLGISLLTDPKAITEVTACRIISLWNSCRINFPGYFKMQIHSLNNKDKERIVEVVKGTFFESCSSHSSSSSSSSSSSISNSSSSY